MPIFGRGANHLSGSLLGLSFFFALSELKREKVTPESDDYNIGLTEQRLNIMTIYFEVYLNMYQVIKTLIIFWDSVVPCNTQDNTLNTPSAAIFLADFLDNRGAGKCLLRAVAFVDRSRRDLPKAAIFVVCAL